MFSRRIWAPFITKVNETFIEGFYFDAWKVLQKRLNFSAQIIPASFKSNTWNSMIETLVNGTNDLILSGNSLTYSRSSYLDFSYPFITSSVRIFYLKNAQSTNWLFYAKSFLPWTWAGVLSFISIIFLLFASLLLLSNQVRN